jgi:prepilin-type N-terminal cleavage/methylation domain-containing protein
MPQRPAFSLVELLVVVTIIVVLVALLVPAMSKAVYQGQLLQCAGRQRASAHGVQSYAWDYQRLYPYRGIVDLEPDGRTYTNFMQVVAPAKLYDIRPALKGYIASVNEMLQCPLTEPSEMENPPPDVIVESSYMFYWGWIFKEQGRQEKGLFRLGDRFTYDEGAYSLLLSDMDIRYNSAFAQASHPDRDASRFEPFIWRERPEFGTRWNLSRWSNRPRTIVRGFLDTNYAYADGSVQRYNAVIGWNRQDPRMDRIPLEFDNINGNNRVYVPSQ